MRLSLARTHKAGLIAYLGVLAARMNMTSPGVEQATAIALAAIATDPVVTSGATSGSLLASIRRLRSGEQTTVPRASLSPATLKVFDALAETVPGDDPTGLVIDGSILIKRDDPGEIARNAAKAVKHLRTIGRWDLAHAIHQQAVETTATMNSQ